MTFDSDYLESVRNFGFNDGYDFLRSLTRLETLYDSVFKLRKCNPEETYVNLLNEIYNECDEVIALNHRYSILDNSEVKGLLKRFEKSRERLLDLAFS